VRPIVGTEVLPFSGKQTRGSLSGTVIQLL
jgi:hypothetical protein